MSRGLLLASCGGHTPLPAYKHAKVRNLGANTPQFRKINVLPGEGGHSANIVFNT